jgi:hypothetical protein
MRVQMTVGGPWQPILKQLVRRLSIGGFMVRRTFDLQLARQSLGTSEQEVCPHHASERCSCQYLVLQVGGAGTSASMVVLHGDDDTTKVSLISAAGEKANADVAAAVCEAVQSRQLRSRGGAPPARDATGAATEARPRAAVTVRKGEQR